MKYLLLCLSVIVMGCGASDQATTADLFKKAHQAVLDGNVEKLQECLTVNETNSAEYNRGLAELMIYALSGDLGKFRDDNSERLEEVKGYALQNMVNKGLVLRFFPGLDMAAEKGVYDSETGIFSIEGVNERLNYVLTEKEGVFTFTYPSGRSDFDPVPVIAFLKELPSAIKLPSADESKAAIWELVLKYVEPTAQEYKDQPISGMVRGSSWSMVSGKAEQQTIRGKKAISINLRDQPAPSECRLTFFGDYGVLFSVEGPGVYDFNQTGVNISLYHDSRNQLVDDGKLEISIDKERNVVIGKITAYSNEDNYVNGTFEIPICGTMDFD